MGGAHLFVFALEVEGDDMSALVADC
jgi:hypothetical protein